MYKWNSKKQQNISPQISVKGFLAQGSNKQTSGQILPVLKKHFAMTKQKLGN